MHDWYLTHGYMHAHMKGPTETIRSHASSRRLPASCETRLKPLCDRSPPAQATPEPSRNPRDPVCVSGLDHFTGPAAGPCVIGWAARWTTSWSGSRTGLFRWGGGGGAFLKWTSSTGSWTVAKVVTGIGNHGGPGRTIYR